MKKIIVLAIAAVSSFIFTAGQAAEIGHYNGGILDIRDYFPPPDPGIYGLLYNYYYDTDRLNNRNGDKINSLTVATPGGPVNLGLSVDLRMFATMPAIAWVAPCEILGARYAGYIGLPFANTSLEADLRIADRVAGRIRSSSLGVGDVFVQPVWLDWGFEHWDLSLAYAFYAPSGRYDTRTFVLPGGGEVPLESASNIGLGYWTQQAQGAVAWYPMTNKTTAVIGALTYEYNGKKEGFELKPGQMLSLNWGIDQFLPLCKNHELLLDVGPVGYDTWQITDSSGGDAIAPNSRSQVHAVGGQVGLINVPWKASLTVHGYYEYAADSRFQGFSVSLNLGIKF